MSDHFPSQLALAASMRSGYSLHRDCGGYRVQCNDGHGRWVRENEVPVLVAMLDGSNPVTVSSPAASEHACATPTPASKSSALEAFLLAADRRVA